MPGTRLLVSKDDFVRYDNNKTDTTPSEHKKTDTTPSENNKTDMTPYQFELFGTTLELLWNPFGYLLIFTNDRQNSDNFWYTG